jgi:hypothetical protein
MEFLRTRNNVSTNSHLELFSSFTVEVSNAKALQPKESCGNCYGAAPTGVCCNTCEDVRMAYARLGWSMDYGQVEQASILHLMGSL